MPVLEHFHKRLNLYEKRRHLTGIYENGRPLRRIRSFVRRQGRLPKARNMRWKTTGR